MKCFGKKGEEEPMLKLFNELLEAKVKPDVDTYNIMLECYAIMKDTKKMMKVYDDMNNEVY